MCQSKKRDAEFQDELNENGPGAREKPGHEQNGQA
jgi:hypothetical protein